MWQFENDKIWDSYSNRGVIKEEFDADMSEEELQVLISDIYTAYEDGNPIEDIADEYGVEVKDVEDAITITKIQLSGENSDDSDLTDEFNLGTDNTDNERGDTIDYKNENDREWDEIHGREMYGRFSSGGNVTDVKPTKPRPKPIYK